MIKLDAFLVLGQSASAPLISKLLADCKIPDLPKIAQGKIEARLAVKACGIDLNFVPSQVFDSARPASEVILGNVLFFGPEYANYGYLTFDGSLPCELTFAMNSEQATATLGSPAKTWENDGFVKSQRWDVQGRHLLIQYSKQTKTIKSIEVSTAKPGT
jgi:hypothetical protein